MAISDYIKLDSALHIALFVSILRPVSTNPCNNNYHVLPFDGERYLHNTVDGRYTLIDDIWLREGWYKINETMLLTTPPDIYMCGTKYPIYMKGALPSDMYTSVQRTACVVSLRSECVQSINIQIAKCDDFYMYYLFPTSVPDSAYCFGTGVEGSRPTFVPQSIPIVIATVIEVTIGRWTINETVFICEFEESTNEELLFKVQWYMNGFNRYNTPYGNGSGDKALYLTEDVFTSEGFVLGIELSCSFNAYVVEDGPSSKRSAVSEQKFIGIKVLTPSLAFDVSESDVSKRSISLQSTIPISCSDTATCEIPFLSYVPPRQISGECQGLGFEVSACGVNINSQNYSAIVNLPIRANDASQYTSRTTFYTVYLRTPELLLEHKIWSNYLLPGISVTLTDREPLAAGSSCRVFNDPHFNSFDGRCFDDHTDGTKVLYRNDIFNTEVQVKYRLCSSNIRCICGVAVRAGYDVYTYYVCDAFKIGYRYCSERSRSFSVIWNGHILEIYFNYGTYLRVTPYGGSSNFLNTIQIYPSINDQDNTKGLCGIYNNDITDDFHDRDGSTIFYPPRECPAFSYEPTDFLAKWRVPEPEDLFSDMFEADNYLQPYTFNMCVCENSTVSKAADTSTGDIANHIPCKSDGAATCKRGQILGTPPRCTLTDRRRRSKRAVPNVPAVFIENMANERKKDAYLKFDFVSVMQRDTQQSFTSDEAEQLCNSRFSDSEIYQLCSQVPSAATSLFLGYCAVDIQLTNSTDFVASNIESMSGDCIEETRRNITLLQYENTADSLIDSIYNAYCPNNCSNNGVCVNGNCVCSQQTGGPDCSIDFTIPPNLSELYNGGLCDTVEQECTMFEVFGGAFANASTLLCKSHLFMMDENGMRAYDEQYISAPTFVTFVELNCKLSQSTRKRRSSHVTNDAFISGYTISITNNGEMYSANRDIFVYNSECQAVENQNGAYKFTLIDGYCYIDHQCIANGQNHPNDRCYFCDFSVETRQWTVNQTNPECQPVRRTTPGAVENDIPDSVNKDEANSLPIIISSTIGGVVVLAIITCVVIVVLKKNSRTKEAYAADSKQVNVNKGPTFQRPLSASEIRII